jgi:hypothetical protein
VVLVLAVPAGAATGATSPAEWRAEADTICRDGGTALFVSLSAAFPNGVPQPPSADDQKLLASTAAPLFQAQHDLIAELERPDKLKTKIKNLLKTFQKGVDTIAEGAETGEVPIDEFANALEPAAKQAQKLGVEVCSASW